MERQPFDIVTLAKRINLRREEYNRLHPHRRFRITSSLSPILENDPDYAPYRERTKDEKRQRASQNPSIRTLVRIADALGTTVGDLLREPQMPLTPAELAEARAAIRTLSSVLP